MSAPRVTVYVCSRNYGRYLQACLESLFRQSFRDWELILIDDASTDATWSEAQRLTAGQAGRVCLLQNPSPQGLRRNANRAVELARGEYVMRLDADDWLDESALLVLVAYLDQHPNAAAVFPNWFWVDERGRLLGVEQRRLIGEQDFLELPFHGACTLVRRRALVAVGGYDPQHESLDGHELWLKLQSRYRIGQVSTPLFFYRQHADSLSRNPERQIRSRRDIKRVVLERQPGALACRVAAVLLAKNRYAEPWLNAGFQIGGRSLLAYAAQSAIAARSIDSIWVSTDDPELDREGLDPSIEVLLRGESVRSVSAGLRDVYAEVWRQLQTRLDPAPDVVVFLSVHTPLRSAASIDEAVDSLRLFPFDEVLSVRETHELHLRYGRSGLEALNASQTAGVQAERETLFTWTGAVHALWREALLPGRLLRGRVGHVTCTRLESLRMKHPEERWLIEHELTARATR
ncbi:MAG: glycosyltransferase [Xanthomonadales bacterium]|jgi:glycosyltransferase involved in cell wall biosynthesis|nr:glycosyltransferase [Xanthomonadales bacterium]